MNTDITLPSWLDGLIFGELGAIYCRTNADMTVIDWDKTEMLNYLGTYFPRSYAESYCIFHEFFDKTHYWNRQSISIMDFCCGTGGEIIALLTVIAESMPWIKNVSVTAIDGNHDALRLFEKVLAVSRTHFPFEVSVNIGPLTIRDIFDLSDLDEIVTGPFDIVMSFKAICEFVSKERFDNKNPYGTVAESLLKKIESNGILLLVDVSSKSYVTNDWLPQMMDRGLSKLTIKSLYQNPGFNQSFWITHSQQSRDLSKVAWRLLIK